jgi:hypothetical protein
MFPIPDVRLIQALAESCWWVGAQSTTNARMAAWTGNERIRTGSSLEGFHELHALTDVNGKI